MKIHSEIRALAIKLFETGVAAKRKQPEEIWGHLREWADLPSESVAVWEAIAASVYKSQSHLDELKAALERGRKAAEGAKVLLESWKPDGYDPVNNDNYCRLVDWLNDAMLEERNKS